MRMWRAAAAIAILVICAAGFSRAAKDDAANFVPPRVISAGGIAYPDPSTGGVVELWLNLDKNGYVRSVHTVRDVPPLTAAVANAVTGWMFSPAFVNGAAVASNILVCAAFNPGTLPSKTISLTQPTWSWLSERPAYMPPEVSSAWSATYPESAAGATVVLDLSLNKEGAVRRSAAIYTTPNLTETAVSAAAHWKFEPGKFEGTAIASHGVAAFIFRAPAIKQGE
jgi:hypothetical protein